MHKVEQKHYFASLPLRAVIIEELNFLNWDFFFPGFPEKHAGIIIEGGADLPFPPRFLKIG